MVETGGCSGAAPRVGVQTGVFGRGGGDWLGRGPWVRGGVQGRH
jgi:hypothetical protein